MKDLKKEVERYTRNNYTRSETIERLKNDGFDISEINAHLAEQLDEAQDRIFLNIFYFFPTFVYLFTLVLISLLCITSDSFVIKISSILALIGILFTTFKYYKENPVAILFVVILQYAGFAFLICAFGARLISDLKIPFLNFVTIIPLAIITFFLAKANYGYYKEINNKLTLS